MFIIVCFVSYMNKTGFGVMLYMYTYLPYVSLCVRGERGERGERDERGERGVTLSLCFFFAPFIGGKVVFLFDIDLSVKKCKVFAICKLWT